MVGLGRGGLKRRRGVIWRQLAGVERAGRAAAGSSRVTSGTGGPEVNGMGGGGAALIGRLRAKGRAHVRSCTTRSASQAQAQAQAPLRLERSRSAPTHPRPQAALDRAWHYIRDNVLHRGLGLGVHAAKGRTHWRAAQGAGAAHDGAAASRAEKEPGVLKLHMVLGAEERSLQQHLQTAAGLGR